MARARTEGGRTGWLAQPSRRDHFLDARGRRICQSGALGYSAREMRPFSLRARGAVLLENSEKNFARETSRIALQFSPPAVHGRDSCARWSLCPLVAVGCLAMPSEDWTESRLLRMIAE